MQEYKVKQYDTKIEAFQQKIGDIKVTFTLPMYTDSNTISEKTVEVKKNEWVVKYTPSDQQKIHYRIVSDSEFNETYEPVPATSPKTPFNPNQELEDKARQFEEAFKRSRYPYGKPSRFYLENESTQFPLYWCYATTPLGGKTSLK